MSLAAGKFFESESGNLILEKEGAIMIKRVLFATVGLVLLGVFFFGRDAASYIGTSVGRIKDSVKKACRSDSNSIVPERW